MDAFELIRTNAAQLHHDVVGGGVDRMHPDAFAAEAARRLALDVVWLPLGDPGLKGARALYDEQTGTICCEAAGSSGERALLLAHEIGHARVHSSATECHADDIDPSRTTEVAPVGLQRVEDYGARERRELHANVFAREFLLPRSMAKELHIQQQLTARSIAAQTGLPTNMVRQQILDALLLPSAIAEPEKQTPPIKQSDPSQDHAARHAGSAFLLQAGPGTGKTRTLVQRVISLIEEGADPAAILVVTFSNRAAGELVERISSVLPDAAPRIWVGTFHAFGLDLVRRYYDRLNLPPDPALFDRSDAIEVLEEILPTLPLVHYRNLWDPAMVLRDVIAAISRAKDELVGPERYRELAQAMLDSATDDDSKMAAAEERLEVASIYALYEQALRDRAAVDFGDLIMRPTLLLEADVALRTSVQLRHRHVLVDEYQDVNRASARLLKAIAGDGRRLWVVGDARQSIYRFRGASSANMVSFTHEYPGASTAQLDLNYRSSREIVDLFVGFSRTMGASQGMLSLNLQSQRGASGTGPEIRRFETLNDEVEGIAATVRELEKNGVPLCDQAVLCRSNARLNDIASGLEARGIPVLHLGSLFERDEIRDLLALLSLAVDPFGDGLVRIATMARYEMPLQDVAIVTQHLRETAKPAIEKLAAAAQLVMLSATAAQSVQRLSADLSGLSRDSAWEYLATWLLDQTRHAVELSEGTTVSARMRAVAVWQFLNFVREQSPTHSSSPIQRTLDRVRQLVLLAEERDLRQVPVGALHMDAVRLMTIHGSKGLEFEAVHALGLTVASVPANYRGHRCPPPDGMVADTGVSDGAAVLKKAHQDEEECLFFVAASRARTYLRLTLCRKQTGGNSRGPSPYLNKIAGYCVELSNPAQLPLPPDAPRPLPIEVHWATHWQVTDRHIKLYEQCPRRFFYTHVLGLGGARKTTAFSRTHDCLYEVIKWLATERLSREPTIAEALAEFDRIWLTRGPKSHPFAADYRRLAAKLVESLVQHGAGRRFRQSLPLAIDFPNGRVVVEPDEMAELPDGTVVLRRVRTGYKRSDEYDRLEYTLYMIAAQAHFGVAYRFEALHLTDDTFEAVTITSQKLEKRRTKSDELLSGVMAGRFPSEPDSVTCPRCPHFFICPAPPSGSLTQL